MTLSDHLGEQPLLAAERRERLLADLQESGMLRVSDIARALGVTTVTVRRDIAQLADEGVIERVRGGIRLPRAEDAQASLPAGVQDTRSEEEARPAVGLVVPSLDYYWPEIIRGAREAAPAAGVRIMLRGSSYEGVDDVRRQTAWLLETAGIQGLLIAPPTKGEAAAGLIAWLTDLPIPVIFVERAPTVGQYHEHVESVCTDHAFGASLAVRHLAAEGHRRIGFFASVTSPTTPAVRRGWQETIADLGLERDEIPEVTSPDYRDPNFSDELDRLLAGCVESGTTALLVHSDREAISLVARCEERGIAVPDGLAVVAYDDEVAGLAHPALSAVRPAKHTIGETAVWLLSQRMQHGSDRPVHRVLVSPQLIVRGSSRTGSR